MRRSIGNRSLLLETIYEESSVHISFSRVLNVLGKTFVFSLVGFVESLFGHQGMLIAPCQI